MPQVITGIGADGIPNTADDIVVSGNAGRSGRSDGCTAPSAPVTPSSPTSPTTRFRSARSPTATSPSASAIRATADAEYDNELLDAHFIAGDGRVNENIGLTAVHHVFHAEHNRLVEHTKDVLETRMLAGGTQARAVAFLNEWLATDVADRSGPQAQLDSSRLGWRAPVPGGEVRHRDAVSAPRVRGIRPQDPAEHQRLPRSRRLRHHDQSDIVAEFAHVVYRFGHSMLTEIDRPLRPDLHREPHRPDRRLPQPDQLRQPTTAIEDGIAAGAIIRGMTRQVGNEIDEFVTSALRNNLLGLPLDLATINLARGRDTGVPSLNEARARVLRGDQPGRPAQALRELGRFRRSSQARSVDHQLHRGLRHAFADHRRRRRSRASATPR